jgi:alkanesulfonate monooxygenase SsuD/methylene tetrahydromethanopterin reductase-like flavin-dependent oxidoreductase (luciferase family)
VEGRFLQATDAPGLCAEAVRAATEGVAAVFVSAGPLGDPIVLAAGLNPSVSGVLLGVRLQFHPRGPHPAMLAREVTSLDLVCGGRSVLCFAPPFVEELPEAVALCRVLWRTAGEVASDGPHFPVRAAAHRARPRGDGTPRVAFDLTGGDELPAGVAIPGDLLLYDGDGASGRCRLERV